MKLSLLLLAILLVFTWADEDAAAGGGDDEEYSAPQPIEEDNLKNTKSLLKLLRSGKTKEELEVIYVVGIKDSKQNDAKRKEETQQMEYDLATLKFEDVKKAEEESDETTEPAGRRNLEGEGDEDAAATEDDSTIYTAQECKDMWEEIKDWPKGSVQYATIDVGTDEFKDIKTDLINPYYTGMADRSTPSIFVLKGTGAYLITGPHPVQALIDVIGDMHAGKGFKK